MKCIIDIDGTLLNGRTANLDALDFCRSLAQNHLDHVLMTNSVSSTSSISHRLRSAGFDIAPERILNPMAAINAYLRKQGIRRTFTVGNHDEIAEIEAAHDVHDPELVVLVDFERTNAAYSTIQQVFSHIHRGVPVVSASGSKYYWKGDTPFVDTGAFVSLFDSLSKRPTVILGKPSAEYFEMGRSLLGCAAAEFTVIGDDWSTDMLGALNIGAKGILVRSGKYTAGDEHKVPGVICVDRFAEIVWR